MTQGGPTQSWKEKKLVEAILSSGKEKGNEKKQRKKETGRRWRRKEQNCVLVCKWTVSLDLQSFLSLVIVTPVVN